MAIEGQDNAGRDAKNDTSTRGNRTTAAGAGVGRVRSISSISKRASWFLAGRSMESLGIGWSSAGLSDGAAGKRGQAGQAGRTRDTTLGDPRTVIGRVGGYKQLWSFQIIGNGAVSANGSPSTRRARSPSTVRTGARRGWHGIFFPCLRMPRTLLCADHQGLST